MFYVAIQFWPVRCMSCMRRQFVPWWRSRHAVSATAAHTGSLRAPETWRDYTGVGPGKKDDGQT
jgi:hypothetical protein